MTIPTAASNRYRITLSVVAFAFLICHPFLWGSAASSASGSAPALQADGLFTADQADRGSAIYATQCAFCHGQGLEGATSTPMAGPRFMKKWGDGKHSIDDLHFVISTQMPYGAAGTLSRQEYVDVVANDLCDQGFKAAWDANEQLYAAHTSKPFAVAEMLARVDALSRRSPWVGMETVLRVGDLEMDLVARTASRAGRQIGLRPREFRLLEYLARHAGEVITRSLLLQHVWGLHFDPATNLIDVYVGRLRRKIDSEQASPIIHTVRGVGFCIRAVA
jgi:mono/diheme cytochrome c family protein